MCECGCCGNNGVFALLALDGWYRLVFSPPCTNCDVGGSLVIEHHDPGDGLYDGWPEKRDILLLGPDGATITCSPGIEELRVAARKAIAGYETKHQDHLDDIDADVIADDLLNHLPQWPAIVVPLADAEAVAKEKD